MDDDSKKAADGMAKNKKKVITHPFLKRKGRMGNGSLCSGYVIGEIFRGDLDGYPCGNEVIKSMLFTYDVNTQEKRD